MSERSAPRPRPTLARIAAELGVSVMTVSNAYNRPDQLSAALRERILEKAQELGYPGPDPVARSLREGRAGALGVLYDTWPAYVFQDPSAVAFLQGLSGASGRAFMGVLLIPAPLPEAGNVTPLDTALVDGFVVYSVADTDLQVRLALARRPTVIVDQPRIDGVPLVGIDDTAAAAAAAQHLLDMGHRRIAVLTFALARDGVEGRASLERQQNAAYHVTRSRLDGYRAALSSAGLEWADIEVYECQRLRQASLAAHHLLTRRPRPTAVLATSDRLAQGVLAAAREANLRVPRDLSVVGFDDSPTAQTSRPPLTTVRQPHVAKGRRASGILLDLLNGKMTPAIELLPTELVIRASTGPAPTRRRPTR